MANHASLRSQSQNPDEHRSAPRVTILAGLGEVVVVNLPSQTGVLLDVSEGGLAVQAVYPISRQASIDIAFPLPFTGDSIEALCKVAWVDEGRRAGLQFLSMADEPKRQLDRWRAQYAERVSAVTANIPEPALVAATTNAGSRQDSDAAAIAGAAPAISAAGAKQMSGRAKLADVLTRAVTEACRLTGADGAAVVLCEPEGVICRASTGEAPDVGSQLQSHSEFTAKCLRTGGVVLSSDVENDPRAHPATVKRLHLRSLLIVPICTETSVIGAVEVLSCRRGAFKLEQATTLQSITDTIASALIFASGTKADEKPRTMVFARSALAHFVEVLSRTKLLAGSRIAKHAAGLSYRWACVKAKQANRLLLNRTRVVLRSRTAPYLFAVSLFLGFAGILVVGGSWRSSTSTPASRAGLLAKQASPARLRTSENMVPLSRESHSLLPDQDRFQSAPARSRAGIGRKPAESGSIAVEPLGRTASRKAIAALSKSRNSTQTLHPPAKLAPSVQSIKARQARNETATRTNLGPPIAPIGLEALPRQNDLLANLTFSAPPPLPRLSPPSHRLRTSEVIVGQAISQPLPPYPDQARRLGVQGSVFVRNVIDINGRIKHVTVLEGDPILAQPTVDAVKQWRYAPTYLDRLPVEMETVDELKFSVTGKAPQVSTPLHLPEGIKRGHPVRQPLPDYPESARRLHMQGTVVLQGIIAVDGKMRMLRLVSGNPLLGQSALQAVKNWCYEPSYLNGKPVEVDTTIVVTFHEL